MARSETSVQPPAQATCQGLTRAVGSARLRAGWWHGQKAAASASHCLFWGGRQVGSRWGWKDAGSWQPEGRECFCYAGF